MPQRLLQSNVIVSVTYKHRKTERTDFSAKIVKGHYVFSSTGNLQAITIHDQGKIVQFILCCGHHCLPDRTFGELTITG